MALLYLLHELRSIRQLVDQRLDDPEHRFGLRCCCLLHSAKQGKPGQVPFFNRHQKQGWKKTNFCAALFESDEVLKSSSYRGAGCESPLRRFMTSVPRIMARLVRPTPTWQLKRRAGSRRDASWPRDKLVLSWKTEKIQSGLSEMADSKTPDRNDRCCISNDMSSAPVPRQVLICWFASKERLKLTVDLEKSGF